MMLLFQVMLLVLPFANCKVADPEDYPTFAPCNQKVISAIKTFWKSRGSPKNNLQQMKESGELTVSDTSFNLYDPPSRCIHMTNTDNEVDFFFVPREGDNETIQIKWAVTEGEDGIIRAKSPFSDDPQRTFEWYTIISNNDLYILYACSPQEGTDLPPLATIMLPRKRQSVTASIAVKKGKTLLNKLGLETKYSYGPDCFLKK